METVLLKVTDANLASLDWEQVTLCLVDMTRKCQLEEYRLGLDDSIFKKLGLVLAFALESGDTDFGLFVEAYRFLRNAVVACRKNQDAVREGSNLFEITRRFLAEATLNHKLCSDQTAEGASDRKGGTDPKDSPENKLIAVRCSLQFLANVVVGNPQNTSTVSSLFMDVLNGVIRTFKDDDKVIQYTAMVVHLILKNTTDDLVIPSSLIEMLLQNLEHELVTYAVESLLAAGNLSNLYEALDSRARIRLLSFLNARSDLVDALNDSFISMIAQSFAERSDFILKSQIGDSDDTFCWEIAVLLETLCSISLSGKATKLTSDQVLLTTILCLLKQIHELGKVGGNVFSIDQDMKKLTTESTNTADLDEIRAHPTFQFKANLVRLIGNTAHRNSKNQVMTRELGCIPIILDCCKIDARNPFIAQWAILAIRNLCEGNKNNQDYIREVQRVDTEKVLPTLQMLDLSN